MKTARNVLLLVAITPVFAWLATAGALWAQRWHWERIMANVVAPDPGTPRPIAVRPTNFIEDMTWMEVRDAMKAGKKTVIIASGGIEQNGPYLVAGKHNIVLRATAAAIAEKLGDALIAPIIPFVPQGNIDPPTLHMKYPSAVSISEHTYRDLLRDLCDCYRVHGFERLLLIADSYGNVAGMKAVARELTERWDKKGLTPGPEIHYIPEYFDEPDLARWAKEQGIKENEEYIHDDFTVTATMMTVDPNSVRMQERLSAGRFHINKIDLSPAEKTVEWGRRVVNYRAQRTVDAVRRLTAKTPSTANP